MLPDFDKMERTGVMAYLNREALSEEGRKAGWAWISADDAKIRKETSDAALDARLAKRAAWTAAAAAMIAATAAIVWPMIK